MKLFLISLLFLTTVYASKSALYLAIEEQNLEKVTNALVNSNNIEERNPAGHTLLMTASGLLNKEIVILLVEKGANVQAHSNFGTGVIHRAAMSKNPEILKYIISKGGNINLITKNSCSPLHMSISYNALQNYGSLENAKELLHHGAQTSINKKCRGYTPL